MPNDDTTTTDDTTTERRKSAKKDIPATCGRPAMYTGLDMCRDRMVDPDHNVCQRCVDLEVPDEAEGAAPSTASVLFQPEFEDRPPPQVATTVDVTPGAAYGTFDPSEASVSEVMDHLAHADAAEVERVVGLEKIAEKPRKAILGILR